MALTTTARGPSAGDATAATSYSFSPDATIAVGKMAVAFIAYDNAGTNGADPYASISDSAGNTWTQREAVLNDPGAANAGIAGGIFTSLLTTQLTTGSTITVSFGSTSVTAKAAALWEVSGSTGTPTYRASGQGTGASSATWSTTTASINSGSALIAGVFREGAAAPSTVDSDTTNGSWSSIHGNLSASGAGSAGAEVWTQSKVVTATGTQTHDLTFAAARDGIAGWIEIEESAGSTTNVAATVAGVSTVAAVISQARPIAAVVGGVSTVAAALTVADTTPDLVATVAGQSTVAAALSQQRPIAATIDGVSTVTAAMRHAFNLPGATINGVSSVTANLSRPANWEVYVNGVNLTAYVKPFGAIRIENRIHEGSGTASIPIRDDTGTLGITTDMSVKVVQRGARLFEGFVRRILKNDYGWSTGPRAYTLECQDYTTLLDDDVIETAYRSTTESDKARIAWLVSTHGTRGVTAGAEVQTLLATMPPGTDDRPEQDFSGKTLREAIEEIARLSGGRYYVDYDKKLHYFATESTTAPYALSDAYNGTTSVAFWDLQLDDDSIDLAHEVLVVGTGVKVWRSIGSPPALGTRRRAVIRDENITTVSQANDIGDAFLDRYGTVRQTGSVMTRAAGFRAGQTVNITHTGHGLSAAPYVIASVTANFAGPEEVDYRLELNDAEMDLGDVITGQRRTIDVLAQQATSQGIALRQLQAAGANLVPDSSFEAATNTAWTVGTGWTYGATPTGTAFRGAKVAKLVRSANTAGDLVLTNYIPVDRTSDYWISVWSRLESRTSGTARISFLEYNAANVLQATTNIDITAAESGWTRHTLHFGPSEAIGRRAFDPDTTKIKIAANSAGASATLTWNLDGVQVERGNVLTAYAPMPEELANVPGEVVIDASGVTIINGALTVKNPGGTVIIDGTSDMFRIVATGTTTFPAQTAPGQTSSSINLTTGLGYTPSTLCYMDTGGRTLTPYIVGTWTTGEINQLKYMEAQYVSGTQDPKLVFYTNAYGANASSTAARYYVLEQTAI